MKIVLSSEQCFVPASHENPLDPGVLKKVLFSEKDLGAGQVKMVNWALLPVGKSFRPHLHEDMQEIFVITAGSVLIRAAGRERRMEAGDAVLIPEKVVHEMSNAGSIDAQYIVFGVAGGHGGKTIVVESQ